MNKDDAAKYIRTDLACESGKCPPADFVHARYERREEGGTTVEVLTVNDDEASSECGKPRGRYVTLSGKALSDGTLGTEDAAKTLEDELRTLIRGVSRKVTGETSVLVAGLGNRSITPDALGARCADKINATRHVMGRFGVFDELGCSSVSVLSPGVLAETGIESVELIKCAAKEVSPDFLIVIDAMAARKASRLASTIQLSDAGLSPGGGVGNRRPAIDRDTVGYPVISIGSPTVVGSSTLIWDALEEAGIDDVSPSLRSVLENGKDFFVTLNDSDAVIERLSDVISRAVNGALGTSEL